MNVLGQGGGVGGLRGIAADEDASGRVDRAEIAGDDPTGVDGDRDRLPDRDSRRHRLGGEEGHRLGLWRESVCAVGHFDAEFLARDHADLPVLDRTRLAAGLRLCPAFRKLARQPCIHHHARLRAGQRHCGGPDAAHAERHVAGAGKRLCPHRPRQGPVRALGHPQARHAQRTDADHHARRARTRHLVVGRGADRADFFHTRFRQTDRRCRVQSRLCRRAGRRAGHGDHLHHAEPDRRHCVHPRQSAAEGLSSMTDAVLGAISIASDELESPARRALRRLFQRKGAVAGMAVIATFIVLAVFAPLLSPYDPVATSWSLVRKPPSALHWFGTDDLGRDIFARVIFGARASLMAGAISVGIALLIGVPFGLLSGYRGGFIDALISRITDAMLACPFLILAIALAAFLGPSLGNAMIALGLTTTPIFVRLTPGQAMSVQVEDHVEAARAMGNPRWRIALFHILPNIMPALLVQATLSIAAAIIAEAALSFLGLGQQPPAPSWGSMLNSAQRYLTSAPWMALWPGLAIFLVVLSFNLVGDGLRDALDPREG